MTMLNDMIHPNYQNNFKADIIKALDTLHNNKDYKSIFIIFSLLFNITKENNLKITCNFGIRSFRIRIINRVCKNYVSIDITDNYVFIILYNVDIHTVSFTKENWIKYNVGKEFLKVINIYPIYGYEYLKTKLELSSSNT